MTEKEVAIIVDLNSMRLIVPESKLDDWGYIQQLAVAELVARVNNNDGIMEGYEEDYDQTDMGENTGE